MMKTPLMIAAAAAALLAGPLVPAAQAAPKAEPVSASMAPTDHAERLVLAKRYFEVIGFEGQLGSILTNLTAPEQLGARPDITEDERDAIVSSAAEAMDEAMPLMIDEAARITARTFTHTQLKDMIAFYESESGKVIAAKTSVLPPMASQLVMSFAPVIKAEVIVRACNKIDCSASPVRAKL